MEEWRCMGAGYCPEVFFFHLQSGGDWIDIVLFLE